MFKLLLVPDINIYVPSQYKKQMWLLTVVFSLTHSYPAPLYYCMEPGIQTSSCFQDIPVDAVWTTIRIFVLNKILVLMSFHGMKDCWDGLKCMKWAPQLDFQLPMVWNLLNNLDWAFTVMRSLEKMELQMQFGLIGSLSLLLPDPASDPVIITINLMDRHNSCTSPRMIWSLHLTLYITVVRDLEMLKHECFFFKIEHCLN